MSDRWQRSQGCVLTHSLAQGLSLESVQENWSKVTDMEGGDFPTANQEATMELVEKLRPPVTTTSDSSSGGFDPVFLSFFLFLYNFAQTTRAPKGKDPPLSI